MEGRKETEINPPPPAEMLCVPAELDEGSWLVDGTTALSDA